MEKLGIPASGEDPSSRQFNWREGPPAWDGKELIIHGRSDSDLIHDIAHWICSAKRRRRQPEFGLGPGPDSWSGDAARTVSMNYADREEGMTSLLGIAIESAFDMDFEQTLRGHGWFENAWDLRGQWSSFFTFWDYISQLMEKGHLDEKGHPTCLT